ncbi:hypothetical protein V8G54_027107 [Vigna mungo]|uniref:Uncharacterized protein n=1 Tax=Vigna mungo TaxID=3915 RepID=A0AAQ3RQ40_VIGMU
MRDTQCFQMMERTIKEHQEERKKRKEVGSGRDDDHIKDLLDVLLDIHEDENSDIKLTKENIKDVFMTGTDIAALTIVWALADRLVEESDLVNLPYLQAIVKETLRIHPTGPLIVRESSESCNIWGYEIPPKTQFRDPNHWENPLEFRPERGQYFHLIPFGSGRRGCPGTSLALQVVQTNLAAMIQCFQWKVKGENETVDMEEKPGSTCCSLTSDHYGGSQYGISTVTHLFDLHHRDCIHTMEKTKEDPPSTKSNGPPPSLVTYTFSPQYLTEIFTSSQSVMDPSCTFSSVQSFVWWLQPQKRPKISSKLTNPPSPTALLKPSPLRP